MAIDLRFRPLEQWPDPKQLRRLRAQFRGAYRDVASTVHPDRVGPNDAWNALQKVSELLEAHHAARK